MITTYNRKHINAIMNIDNSLLDDRAVVEKALEIVAQMCDPSVRDYGALFYIDTDDEGRIKLEMEV